MVERQDKILIISILFIALLILGIYLTGRDKPSSALLLEDSELTVSKDLHLKVTELTSDRLILDITDFNTMYTNSYTFRRSDIFYSGYNDFYLVVRDFFTYTDREGKLRHAAIITQHGIKSTLPSFCIGDSCIFAKRVYTAWLPVESPTVKVPVQTVVPIPVTIGGVAPLPVTAEKVRTVSLSTIGGDSMTFGRSTYGDYPLITDTRPGRNVSWVYGTDRTGYIKYRELAGFFVEYKGTIIKNGQEYRQSYHPIIQINTPGWYVDAPERKYVFEVVATPEKGVYKITDYCVGYNCKELR